MYLHYSGITLSRKRFIQSFLLNMKAPSGSEGGAGREAGSLRGTAGAVAFDSFAVNFLADEIQQIDIRINAARGHSIMLLK